MSKALQEPKRVRVRLPLRLASRAVGLKLCPSKFVQDGFGHDRTRRVAGAKKQHVERAFPHGAPHAAQPVAQPVDSSGAVACGTQHDLECATRGSFSTLTP